MKHKPYDAMYAILPQYLWETIRKLHLKQIKEEKRHSNEILNNKVKPINSN